MPQDADGLHAALGKAHRRYTWMINARKGWTGYFWQGRFASVVMDESHLMTCVRYVEQNPVRARLVERARDWRWSSARAHLSGRDDGLVRVRPLLKHVDDWNTFLGEHTGRPLAAPSFLKQSEKRLGRTLTKQKPGPKPKDSGSDGSKGESESER